MPQKAEQRMRKASKKSTRKQARARAPKFGAKLQDKATGLVGTLTGVYTTATRGPRYELTYLDSTGRSQVQWVDSEATKAAK